MRNLKCLGLLLLSTTLTYAADEICVKHVVVPEYPKIALMARVQATMAVELTISTAGKVLYATATGHPLFKTAAEETLKQWTFAPVDAAFGLRTAKITVDYGIADTTPVGATFDLPDRVQVRVQAPSVQPNYAAAK